MASCEHYQRKCALFAPCCSKSYPCRVCHDDVEDHSLMRTSVELITCLQCNQRQKVAEHCVDCGILFGKYSCLKCRLYDDVDKKQFHCDGCGICRVGGTENFFHCEKCNMCIGIHMRGDHKCVENMSRRNCPVCLEDLHTSRQSMHLPSCGHMLHRKCFEGMLEHGKSSCAVCNTSMIDMTAYWRRLDEEIARTIMPAVFRSYHVNILCQDCHSKSKVLFHVIGLKCQSCGGYNTTRVGGDDLPPTDDDEGVVEATSEDVERLEGSWETVSEGEDS